MLGIVAKVKKIFTRNNEPMLFVKLEDSTGSVEVVVFPSNYQTESEIWQEEKIVLLKGKLSVKEKEIKILSEKVMEVTPESLTKLLKGKNTTSASIANSS